MAEIQAKRDFMLIRRMRRLDCGAILRKPLDDDSLHQSVAMSFSVRNRESEVTNGA